MPDQSDSRIGALILGRNLCRAIGGAVVDDDQLEFLEGLGQNTVDGLPEKSFTLVDGHEDGHEGPHLDDPLRTCLSLGRSVLTIDGTDMGRPRVQSHRDNPGDRSQPSLWLMAMKSRFGVETESGPLRSWLRGSPRSALTLELSASA